MYNSQINVYLLTGFGIEINNMEIAFLETTVEKISKPLFWKSHRLAA